MSSPTASKTFGLRPNGNPPTAGNNTGASRLTMGASRPNKEHAYGEKNLRPNENPPSADNNTGASRLTTGASRPDKELAYGEQNVRPSAELKPAYGGQIIRLLVFEQTEKSEKRGSRPKKGPRPKIEIRFGHSYSRSHRVPTYQISSSYDFK